MFRGNDSMRRLRGDRRLLLGLLTLVVAGAICLIAVLAYNIVTNNGQPTIVDDTNETPQSEATALVETEVEATPEADDEADDNESSETEATPTSTDNDPSSDEDDAPTEEAESTPEPTAVPETPTPAPTSSDESEAGDFESPAASSTTETITPTTRTIVTYNPGEILTNDNFEGRFINGVARGWTPFQTDGVLAIFSREVAPYINSGQAAQRITLVGATQPNRYAGLSQQVDVVANQAHTLSLHGQVRSRIGDITQSSYGYRMQYGIDYAGGSRWERVKNWVELPWDETPIVGANTTLLSYTTTITPPTGQLTLFVRGWNKWPDQTEAQYSLDDVSLIGPIATVQTIVLAETTPSPDGASFAPGDSGDKQALVNNGLPVTGRLTGLAQNGTVWAGLVFLTLLVTALAYRLRRQERL